MKEAAKHAHQQGQARLDPLEVVDWEAQFLRLLSHPPEELPHLLTYPEAQELLASL